MQDNETERALPQAFPTKRARIVRPGFLGITIHETEYVMPIAEANELVGMIYAAKHVSGPPHTPLINGDRVRFSRAAATEGVDRGWAPGRIGTVTKVRPGKIYSVLWDGLRYPQTYRGTLLERVGLGGQEIVEDGADAQT